MKTWSVSVESSKGDRRSRAWLIGYGIWLAVGYMGVLGIGWRFPGHLGFWIGLLLAAVSMLSVLVFGSRGKP